MGACSGDVPIAGWQIDLNDLISIVVSNIAMEEFKTKDDYLLFDPRRCDPRNHIRNEVPSYRPDATPGVHICDKV